MTSVAIIWMSSGNSYFKENIIREIAIFASRKFSDVVIISPDEPADHTFNAIGYNVPESKKKARLNANLLLNRARRAISGLDGKIIIAEWKDVASNNAYRTEYKNIISLYNKNEIFRQDARNATKEVLTGKSKKADMESAIDEGVFYLLKELAFLLASPKIYDSEEVTYIYHKKWQIFQNLISGLYDNHSKKQLEFLLHN
ncbi:MAG: tRNA-dependent cyclodipeptide synthase [Candidatus Aenigmarchaeota archaeon]|nr:tRNA-dependent cyclodipeptide synthase [Candidatus Aenigmarchaeota archaeon]